MRQRQTPVTRTVATLFASTASPTFSSISKLNRYQRMTLDKFKAKGLLELDFADKKWFDSKYHHKAFCILVDKKSFTIEQAFAELNDLDAQQARGIFEGLTRSEVEHLNMFQINAILWSGLTFDAIKQDCYLNDFQVVTWATLRDRGLPADEFYQQVRIIYDTQIDDTLKEIWFKHTYYKVALLYLVTVRKLSINDALKELTGLNHTQAYALTYGCIKDDIAHLPEEKVKEIIIETKKQNSIDVSTQPDLTPSQAELITNLYHYGLRGSLIKKYSRTAERSKKVQVSCEYLVKILGYSVQEILNCIQQFNDEQIRGMALGLTKEEVVGLNKYQMKALTKSRTYRNGLCRETFLGKDWFNSKEHVKALQELLSTWTVQEAMAELEDTTPNQAALISKGVTRNSVIGLTKWQLKTFNLMSTQQLQLLVDMPAYLLTDSKLVDEATWLQNDEQLEVLKHLVNILNDGSQALHLLQHFNDTQVKELLATHEKMVKIKIEKIQEVAVVAASMEAFKLDAEGGSSSQTQTNQGGCSMM